MKVANPVSVSWRWRSGFGAVALAGLLAVAGCDGERGVGMPGEAAPVEAVRPAETYFPVGIGEATANLQLALTRPEMQRGLMGRTDLGKDDGMVFIYEQPERMSFWMRNTPTPLDIGFFDAEGVLREAYPLYPYDETPVRSRSLVIKYAVEMRQGWYAGRGVRSGARLDLQALADAVRARGGDPRALGMAE